MKKYINNFRKFSIKESADVKFELGTPAIYHYIGYNGEQIEVAGEIVLNREEYKEHAPRTIKGMSLYRDSNYGGDGYRFIVPDWNNVETFQEANARNGSKYIINK